MVSPPKFIVHLSSPRHSCMSDSMYRSQRHQPNHSWLRNTQNWLLPQSCEDVTWIHLARGRAQLNAVVDAVMNIRVPLNAESFFASPWSLSKILMSTTFRIYSDVLFWVVTPCGLRSWIPTFRRNIPTYLGFKCVGWRFDFFGRIQGIWSRRFARGGEEMEATCFLRNVHISSIMPLHLSEMTVQSIYWAGRRRSCGSIR
jgi:hypothetical protein